MIETVMVSLIFSLVKGCKLSNIFKLIKHWSFYPIIAMCLLNIYVINSIVHGDYRIFEYAGYIKTITIILYIGLIWEYKLFNVSIFTKIRYKVNPKLTTLTSPVFIGVICIWIGSGLNYIAMKVNNMKMPIFPDISFSSGYFKSDIFDKATLFKDFHEFGNYSTNLIFLTDIFDCFYSVMSIGDILIRAFVVMVIYYSIKSIEAKNNILTSKDI